MRFAPRTTFVAALLVAQAASAGGYDTPVLYSARHMGMGGTGISWVSDPTAMFMNPAGVGHTEFITLHLDISPIIATIEAVPAADTPAKAGPALLTPLLAGANFRLWKYLSFGLAFYPVASASGGYDYHINTSNLDVKDETTIRFYELSPVLAFNYKDTFTLGIGYRMTLSELKRLQERSGVVTASIFDFEASGWDFAGIRVGAQYKPSDFFSIGINYRHKIEPVTKADSGKFLASDAVDVEYPLVLPSRLGVGMRTDLPLPIGSLGVSIDAEYAFQSQNSSSTIKYKRVNADGTNSPVELEVPFFWKDAWTVRWGAEYSFLDHWATRIGFVWDQETSNRNYSSAFGTPPADTFSYTIGAGYKSTHWELNLAYAYRHGQTDVTKEETTKEGGREVQCLTCSSAGNHEISLHGIYLDFSWYFDLPSSVSDWSPKADD